MKTLYLETQQRYGYEQRRELVARVTFAVAYTIAVGGLFTLLGIWRIG